MAGWSREAFKAGRGLKAIQEDQEGLGGPAGGPGGSYRILSRRARSCWEGWEGSGGPCRDLGGAESPSQRTRRGSKALPVGRDRTEDPLGGPAGVLMPFQRAWRGQEALLEDREGSVGLPEGREWLGAPPGGPAWVGRPSQRVGRFREALLAGQEGSEDTAGRLAVIRRPCRLAGPGQKTLLEGWE